MMRKCPLGGAKLGSTVNVRSDIEMGKYRKISLIGFAMLKELFIECLSFHCRKAVFPHLKIVDSKSAPRATLQEHYRYRSLGQLD